jgi:hypothetical protein
MENEITSNMQEPQGEAIEKITEAAQTVKVDELTEEQIKMADVYTKKWAEIGCNTDRLDPERTKEIVRGFRELIELDPETPTLIVDNPVEAWIACHLITHYNYPIDQAAIEEGLDKVFQGNPDRLKIPNTRLPWQCGSFYASSFAFYDYAFNYLKVEIPDDMMEKYNKWSATAELGCVYPLPEYTIVSQKPTAMHLGEPGEGPNGAHMGLPHCENGPAFEYAGRGNIRIFALNGVTVPEWLVMTPEEQLDLDKYTTITNADVKAEFVRKVGIERFKEKGTIVDSYKNYEGPQYEWWHKSQYEVYDMACLFPNLQSAPYLSMVNQTTGVLHFEGVSPEAGQSLATAIKERFRGRDLIITDIA